MPLRRDPTSYDDGPRAAGGARAVAPVPVLVVDDRRENLVAVESVLRGAGYDLVLASSGAEALRFLLHGDCAVILLDVQMPDMDGFETARLIRGNERTRAIPIVFLTAVSRDEHFIARGYATGAIDYLVKPIDPDVLRSKVWAFGELYRARQEILRQAALLREGERVERQRVLEQLELRSLRRQRAAADRYRRLVEGITHAIVWTLEPTSLACTFVSPSTQAILGVPPDAWTRTPDAWRHRLPAEDRERLLAAASSLVEGASTLVDHALVHADGPIRRFRTNLQLCPAEEEGQLEIRAFSVDLTDERRAEETLSFLARAAAELATSLEVDATVQRAASVAVPFLADACAVTADLGDGRGMASAAAHVDDARLGEAHALPDHPAAPRGRALLRTQIVTLRGDAAPGAPAAGGALLVVPLAARDRRLGGLYLFRAAGRAFSPGDVHVAEDFAFRAAQAIEHALLYGEAREAVRARDEFISVASHELRTPLTPLSLQTSALRVMLDAQLAPGPLRDGLLERISRCSRQIDRMARLVGNLLDVTRMRARRLQLDLETFDLCETVRDAAARCQEEIASTGRRVEVAVAEPELRGRWDRSRLEQVVANLLGNAVRYGGSGPIEVALRRGDPGVLLEVSDHGAGIASQDQARIFDRFERAGNAEANGGLGLGLYIVRHIVEAHRGRIGVESQPGAGSTFRVEIPLDAAAPCDEGPGGDATGAGGTLPASP